jgi:hypothetical protein
MDDPYASATVSLVLAWLFALPLLLYIVSGVLGALFTKHKDIPWGVSAWFTLCVFVISPFRYMLLQMIAGESFAVQSWAAFIQSLFLLPYIPFVFGLLYFLGMGLPFLVIILLAGKETKFRIGLAMVAMPFLCAIGYALFFAALPYATWTIGWLRDRDVVSAANGPATFFYRFAVKPDIPRIGPQLTDNIGTTANAQLRNHIFNAYVSRSKQARRHMLNTREQIELGQSLVDKEGEIPESEVAKSLAAYKQALQEAKATDLEELNERYAGLGDAWRDKLIPALEAIIKSLEEPGFFASMRANALFREWAEWYNSHVAAASE